MTAKEKITKARAGLIMDMPFFGSLALRLKVIEDATCKTGWTDGEYIGYNPAFLENLTLEETKGFLSHEVLHVCLDHNTRRGQKEPKRWNRAGDLAINPLLIESNMVLPKGFLYDQTLLNMSSEEIYNRLPPEEETGESSKQENKSEGKEQKDDEGNSGTGDGDSNTDEGDGNDTSSDPGGSGEVRDAKSPDGGNASKADLDQKAAEWKIAVAQAAQQAKAMGLLPAGLDRFVEKVLGPKVNWREVLWQFVDQTAKNDYRWSIPNRRYAHLGLFLPSLKSEELQHMVKVDDSSISIDQEMVAQFNAELGAILETYRTSVTVMGCDAAVQNVEHYTSDDLPIVFNPKGGGGTDFRPPFKWVEDQGITPSCLIYLTDLECTSFPEDPGYPVLWIKVGEWGEKPPFGEVIEMRP